MDKLSATPTMPTLQLPTPTGDTDASDDSDFSDVPDAQFKDCGTCRRKIKKTGLKPALNAVLRTILVVAGLLGARMMVVITVAVELSTLLQAVLS